MGDPPGAVAAVGGSIMPVRAVGWINGGGGGWVNRRGYGGGGAWVNR